MILKSNVIKFTLLGDYYGDRLEAALDTTEWLSACTHTHTHTHTQLGGQRSLFDMLNV